MLLFGTLLAAAAPGVSEAKVSGDTASEVPSTMPDDATCAKIWSEAQQTGDTLSEAQASSFVSDFNLVDAHSDGIISETEFKDGCKNGLIQETAAAQQPGRD
jgi:hypothetical protein